MENLRLAKYQKKLSKTLLQLQSLGECADDREQSECAELRLKLDKYERKIKQASEGEEEFKAEGETASLEIDKSGISLLLFYAYVEPAWSAAYHQKTLHWAEQTLTALNVTGRLRIAREGFNGTLTGSYDGIRAFTDALRGRDNGYFAHMNNKDDFKITDNLPIGQAFPKLKVFAVTELVNYGLGIDNAPSVHSGGVHLDPRDYHEKLLEENTVVIDVRNSYEAEIGRFAPELVAHRGAEYIDPKMRVSTEFPAWARENIDKLRDKQVLMYCTGGIRCERASALMRSLGHDRVFQLKGGIHNYLEEYADEGGGLWVGKNYTFDKRFAHGATNQAVDEDLSSHVQSSGSKGNSRSGIVGKNEKIFGQCASCTVPWDKYRGRKRCFVCGVPLLLCPQCLNKDTKNVKCALCKEDEKEGHEPFNKRKHYNDLLLANMGEDGEGVAGISNELKAVVSKKRLRGIHSCGVCEETFTSRNALFRHINESGHANRKAKKKQKQR